MTGYAGATFEVYHDAGGWGWRLVDGDEPVAVTRRTFDSAGAARDAVDDVRAALADIEHVAFDETDPVAGDPALLVRHRGDIYEWTLEAESTLAVAHHTYTSADRAAAAARRLADVAIGALPVVFAGSDAEHDPYEPFEVGVFDGLRTVAASLLGRGRRHRSFLDRVDTRIVVSGIRGKSSTTRRLDDVFTRRGYDTLTKITGNRPHLLRNGDLVPIERQGPRTTLYENIRVMRTFVDELDRYSPEDVAIFENQGITEYTTRLFNETFIRPDVVVLANVRQDHQDTLGKTRRDLARSFARSVPVGAHVVSGEQNAALSRYMREEVEARGGTFEQVSVPDRHDGAIGAETVHAVDAVLEYLELDPLPQSETDRYVAAMQPDWHRLPGGRVFNGAEINDVESTEMLRQRLAGDEEILPFVYLRPDRRSRSASFAEYLNTLADRDLIGRAHAGGRRTRAFATAVDVPVERHSHTDDADTVLETMLEEGYPVMLMGNTVDEFMRDMETAIEHRLARRTELEAD